VKSNATVALDAGVLSSKNFHGLSWPSI